MEHEPITKTGPFVVQPNLVEYERSRSEFEWGVEQRGLSLLPGGRWNIAYEAVDRHGRGERAEHVAIRWLGKKAETRDLTYAQLAAETSRFASGLRAIGVNEGARVFVLSHRIPALYIAALGTVKHRVGRCPLFSAFGPEPVRNQDGAR